MIGAGRATPRPIWEHLGSPTSEDWRSLVYAAGYAADERSAPLPAVRALYAELERLQAPGGASAIQVREALVAAMTAIYDTALVLGVALARTWPDRLEDLDAWPNRALALAEIEPEDATAPLPPTVND